MKEEKLGKLLNELADRIPKAVRPGLAEDIKSRIPQDIKPHRVGLDTINIIIDLRISKLAAAAVIIITLVLLAGLLSGSDSTDGGIYQDGKLLIRHFLAGGIIDRAEPLAKTIQQSKKVVYYGDCIDPDDSNAVLMQWKISNNEYRVIFADGRAKTVNAEELIKLQARMLQNSTK